MESAPRYLLVERNAELEGLVGRGLVTVVGAYPVVPAASQPILPDGASLTAEKVASMSASEFVRAAKEAGYTKPGKGKLFMLKELKQDVEGCRRKAIDFLAAPKATVPKKVPTARAANTGGNKSVGKVDDKADGTTDDTTDEKEGTSEDTSVSVKPTGAKPDDSKGKKEPKKGKEAKKTLLALDAIRDNDHIPRRPTLDDSDSFDDDPTEGGFLNLNLGSSQSAPPLSREVVMNLKKVAELRSLIKQHNLNGREGSGKIGLAKLRTENIDEYKKKVCDLLGL